MVQVGSAMLPGTGSTAGSAMTPQVQAALAQQAANQAAAAAAKAEKEATAAQITPLGYGTGPFDPRGAVQIPNNFWGFVILMMGLKS